MTTTASSYKIGSGTTTGNFFLLSTVAIEPESQFKEGATSVKLADGSTRWLGYPVATWHYGYLTQAQWDALKAYCTEASASVYIATMDNNGDYIVYSAIMNMPDEYTIRATRYMDVTIQFSHLVEV